MQSSVVFFFFQFHVHHIKYDNAQFQYFEKKNRKKIIYANILSRIAMKSICQTVKLLMVTLLLDFFVSVDFTQHFFHFFFFFFFRFILLFIIVSVKFENELRISQLIQFFLFSFVVEGKFQVQKIKTANRYVPKLFFFQSPNQSIIMIIFFLLSVIKLRCHIFTYVRIGYTYFTFLILASFSL